MALSYSLWEFPNTWKYLTVFKKNWYFRLIFVPNHKVTTYSMYSGINQICNEHNFFLIFAEIFEPLSILNLAVNDKL